MPVPLLVASLAVAAVGAGVSVAGQMQQKSAAKKMAAAEQDRILQEQAIEAQRQKQMELEAKRRQLEILRQGQRARSLALATTTNQGAQFGSGLEGAYGQASGQEGSQLLAGTQNLEIGRGIFGLNQNVTADRIRYSQGQSNYQSGAALSSLGGTIISSAGAISRIGGSFGGGSGMSFGTGPGAWGSNNRFS